MHQQALLYAYPIMDAYQKNKMASNSTRIHYITQCYTLNTEELNQTTESILNCLSDIVKLIGESNRIFRCQFVSSSSTLTEGFIMNTINPFFEVETFSFIEYSSK